MNYLANNFTTEYYILTFIHSAFHKYFLNSVRVLTLFKSVCEALERYP